MSFQDPRYNFESSPNRFSEADEVRGLSRIWIAGAIAVLVLLAVLVASFHGSSERVATQQPPAATSQMAPRTTPAAPPATAPRPAAPAENTGAR
jgi:hypothetical protein